MNYGALLFLPRGARTKEPLKFTFVEEWESLEDLQVHSQSEHLKAGRARLEGKVVVPNWVQILEQVA